MLLEICSSLDLDKWKNNPAFAQRMREACHTVLYVICNYSAAMNGMSSNTKIVDLTSWWKLTLNVLVNIFCVLTLIMVGLLITTYNLKIKEKK